jgi:endogenous inhibitor of DNA gyrase (YacG/DUF329 family)
MMEEVEMDRIMIRCPIRGEAVPTGILMERALFEDKKNVMEGIIVGPCPACGKNHPWNKTYSFLEGDPEA